MSTKMGYGDMIVAKWKSIARHITNKHENHPDELFPKCAHGELDERLWLQVGTKSYQRLSSILLKKSVLKDVKKLSSEAQTSCLEGFNSTLNGWHPKMTHFSWLGTYCR
ncbi:uncharacterized protein LOC124449458 [Xenia sp. Carnegie-2017]|uniref:uncharacterized protein LOC124449458 n=1 Tax=Xenia sp. Carnegie-2017 TaxID=2897299 RepID=UPI001F03E5C8|nr:uncharacterized protein LOC124449458 [Xenia sp. Carnegie-2017]